MTGQRGPPLPGKKTKVLSRVPSHISTMTWKARAPVRSSTTCISLSPPRLLTVREIYSRFSEVGFRQRPGRATDRHSRRRFPVDDRPATFEQRQGCARKVEDAVDQGRRLHVIVAQRRVCGKRFPADISGHFGALRRLEPARRPAQPLVAGERAARSGQAVYGREERF